MNLRDLRLAKGISQTEASKFVGMPLRTYQRYEKNSSYEGSIKYKYVYQRLEKYGFVDEEHGILTRDEISAACGRVFPKYDTDFAYLFGSYAKNMAKDRSDVDLLVSTGRDDAWLAEAMRELRENLHKRVDMLGMNEIMNNPDLVHEILDEGVRIYKRPAAGETA